MSNYFRIKNWRFCWKQGGRLSVFPFLSLSTFPPLIFCVLCVTLPTGICKSFLKLKYCFGVVFLPTYRALVCKTDRNSSNKSNYKETTTKTCWGERYFQRNQLILKNLGADGVDRLYHAFKSPYFCKAAQLVVHYLGGEAITKNIQRWCSIFLKQMILACLQGNAQVMPTTRLKTMAATQERSILHNAFHWRLNSLPVNLLAHDFLQWDL